MLKQTMSKEQLIKELQAAMEKLAEEVQKMKQQEESKIITPGTAKEDSRIIVPGR